MALSIVLILIALFGFAAYAYLRANGIDTVGEERFTLVLGSAFALLLRPQSPTEFAAELVGLIAVLLGVASIARLAAVALRDGRRVTEVPG